MTDQAVASPAPEAPKKRPASQYYWGDWWKDKGLHSCSLTARGLWHEMNCLMHEGEPYGHLTLNGRAMTVAQLANQCRISAAQCGKLLQELEAAGVPSRTAEGTIFSRRMVRDEDLRNARAEVGKANGAKGAEFGKLGAEHGKKGGRPRKENRDEEPGKKPPKNPHPSSSSSSSSSLGDTEDLERAERARAQAEADGFTPTAAGAACRAMRLAGFSETNPGDPRLLALLEQGATAEELAAAAADATKASKGWGWLLAAVEGRRADAARIRLAPATNKHSGFAAKDYRKGVNADGSLV